MANTHSGTFDGTGDWAENSATGAVLPSGSDASTLECWVKTSASGYVAGWGSTTAYRALFIDSSSVVSLRTNEGKNTQWTAAVMDGAWHHLALVYPAATAMGSSVLLYVDGSAATYSTSAGAALATGTGYMDIATTPDHSVPLNGLVDEVRIWNDVRTGTEITANKDTELVGNETGLVGYWKMNNDWTDTSATGIDLTAAGNATFSTDVPFSGAVASVSTLSLLGVGT